MLATNDRRTLGSGVGVVLLLLLIAGVVLGLNYVRNYRIERQDPNTDRPWARYQPADLELLAAGYRVELAGTEKRQGASRAQVRQRHRFRDQVQEFERVQKQSRRSRDKALDIAQIHTDLEAIEAEQQRRASFTSTVSMHLTRLFRL